MSIQYIFAPEGKEYRSTYIGRMYHLHDKIKADPRLKRRVPRRWLSNGWVVEVDKDGDHS